MLEKLLGIKVTSDLSQNFHYFEDKMKEITRAQILAAKRVAKIKPNKEIKYE